MGLVNRLYDKIENFNDSLLEVIPDRLQISFNFDNLPAFSPF